LDGLKRKSTSSAQSKVQYMQNVSKFDKGHMIAMTEHVLYPKASTENQGHAIENIFLSIDTKKQRLITRRRSRLQVCKVPSLWRA
jgi:hypothetical protein